MFFTLHTRSEVRSNVVPRSSLAANRVVLAPNIPFLTGWLSAGTAS